MRARSCTCAAAAATPASRAVESRRRRPSLGRSEPNDLKRATRRRRAVAARGGVSCLPGPREHHLLGRPAVLSTCLKPRSVAADGTANAVVRVVYAVDSIYLLRYTRRGERLCRPRGARAPAPPRRLASRRAAGE